MADEGPLPAEPGPAFASLAPDLGFDNLAHINNEMCVEEPAAVRANLDRIMRIAG